MGHIYFKLNIALNVYTSILSMPTILLNCVPLGSDYTLLLVIDIPQGSCGVWCYEAEPSNPAGITYTTASEESMWLVPQLTAFHQ